MAVVETLPPIVKLPDVSTDGVEMPAEKVSSDVAVSVVVFLKYKRLACASVMPFPLLVVVVVVVG
jgi:hypothetical protein